MSMFIVYFVYDFIYNNNYILTCIQNLAEPEKKKGKELTNGQRTLTTDRIAEGEFFTEDKVM